MNLRYITIHYNTLQYEYITIKLIIHYNKLYITIYYTGSCWTLWEKWYLTNCYITNYLFITVTLGTMLSGCYTEVACL